MQAGIGELFYFHHLCPGQVKENHIILILILFIPEDGLIHSRINLYGTADYYRIK